MQINHYSREGIVTSWIQRGIKAFTWCYDVSFAAFYLTPSSESKRTHVILKLNKHTGMVDNYWH